MNNYIYAYLRASTKEQDANRAKSTLDEFAQSHGFRIAAYFVENKSGATLERPELERLLDNAQNGDILLVESIDRLSRLNQESWQLLKTKLTEKQIKIVALDVPTSHSFLAVDDELTDSILHAMNNMLIDILAAMARHDYLTRRKRQLQGIEKAKLLGKYRGRPADTKKHQKIIDLLEHDYSYRDIANLLQVSIGTVARVKKMHSDQI